VQAESNCGTAAGTDMDRERIKNIINERHSVRQYLTKPIEETKRNSLNSLIEICNRESGLNMQLICDDPKCFDVFLAHYGKFKNAVNYIAIIGKKDLPDLEEKAGYYGQRIVLFAQESGLNTCWVAGTFGKKKCKAKVAKGEKILCVIAIGYGENPGKEHHSKPVKSVCNVKEEDMPGWFREGVDAALKAPTAINQQKFSIRLEDGEAVITAKSGPMTKIDLGIVKYNFEAASGHKAR
jgi:hypothetical protein